MRILALLAMGAAVVFMPVSSFATLPSGQERPPAARGISANPTPIPGAPTFRARGEPQAMPGQFIDISGNQKWLGTQSRAPRPGTYVMRDKQEWENIWRIVGEATPPVALPGGDMGLAVFGGPKTTDGYSLGIVSVRRDGENLYVSYILNRPRNPDHARAVATSPWIIMTIPSTTGRVRFTSVTQPGQ